MCEVIKEFGICWIRVLVEMNFEDCVWIKEFVNNFNKFVMVDVENFKLILFNYGIR